MNTNQMHSDEQAYHETLIRKNSAPRNPFNWVPLLLIPLFFVLGWVTKGAYDVPNNEVNTPHYGVGGGPGNITPYNTSNPIVTAEPTTQPVTATIAPAVSPEIDPEVQDTPNPTSSE